MDTFYVRRNGLNDDDLLPRRSVSPKIADNLTAIKTPTEQVFVPAAGKSSVALNQTRQSEPPVESLSGTNIQQNQQITPQTHSAEAVTQNVDLKQNTQFESQPTNLPPCPQEVKVQEPGDHPPAPPQPQFVPTAGQIQIPLTAVPQDDGSQITYVEGQLRASQQKQRIPESPTVPANYPPPHPECPRCATYLSPQGAPNYAPNGPVSVSNSAQQQPNSQAPEVVQPNATAIANSFGSVAPSNPGGPIPSSQAPYSKGDQDLPHKNLNGLREELPGPRNITEITHPAAAYNAYNQMRAAGVPTKYGHNFFYR